jgi:hypothetical protein
MFAPKHERARSRLVLGGRDLTGLRPGAGHARESGRLLNRRCCSSVVEHSLGKGEVESSIPSSSTMILLNIFGDSSFGFSSMWTSDANERVRRLPHSVGAVVAVPVFDHLH